MKYFLWWPGYLYIAVQYFFTSEWGKTRSVSKSSRRWKYKDKLAPLFSLPLYIIFWMFVLAAIGNSNKIEQNQSQYGSSYE